MILMRSQKNELLEEIKGTMLEPFNFEWSVQDIKTSKVPMEVLKYNETNYRFTIGAANLGYQVMYSPGKDKMYERDEPFDWGGVLYCFRSWLKYLDREISIPDLWAEIENGKAFGGLIYELDYNSNDEMNQFTYQQTMQIENGINDVRGYLVEKINGNTETIEEMNNKLDYLIDTSKRMGKKDWVNVFIGVLTTIFTSLGLDQDQRYAAIMLFQKAISGIIRLVK